MTKSHEEEEEVVEQDQDISGKSLEIIPEAQTVSGHISEGLGSPGKSGEVLMKYFGQRSSPFDPCWGGIVHFTHLFNIFMIFFKQKLFISVKYI